MKRKLFALLSTVIVFLMLTSAVLPAHAQLENPYGVSDVGCITNIEMESNAELLGGLNYFNAVVTSHIQGLDEKAAIPYRTYGAIGNENTKMFVYSIGAENGLDYARATTKQLVERFESENPAWNAVVAVNGDFFDIEKTLTESMGEPEFPMIQLGDSYKTHVLLTATGRGIVGTTADGKMVYYTVGGKYKEHGYGQEMTVSGNYMLGVLGEHQTNTVAEYPADVARRPVDRAVSFITPDSLSRSFEGATVYVVKCDTYRRSHVGINGSEIGTTGYFIEGEIVEIREGKAKEKAPEGYVYFAVTKPEYYHLLTLGTHVRCQKVLTGEWENVENAIGFKQQILAEGNILLKNCYGTYNKGGDQSKTLEWTEDIYDYPFCWKNRTAIGFREDGTPVMLVLGKSLDGGTYKNLGASYYEIGEQLKALGCTNGFLLDGGGSSTFVIRNGDGSFSNAFVGEGNGRAVANAVILAVRDESVPLPELDAEQAVIEWPVEQPSEKQTEKKTEKITESATEQPTEEQTDPAKQVGCTAIVAMPCVTVALSMTSVGVLRRRKKK